MSRKLKLDAKFKPQAVEAGDETFPNGIFEFNITRLLKFIETRPGEFPIVPIAIADIPNHGEPRDEMGIAGADLSRPVLFAEISPSRYNLIDGHHRLAKARRQGVLHLPAWRAACPAHVAFLTSTKAYRAYVEYWNEKLCDQQRGFALQLDS